MLQACGTGAAEVKPSSNFFASSDVSCESSSRSSQLRIDIDVLFIMLINIGGIFNWSLKNPPKSPFIKGDFSSPFFKGGVRGGLPNYWQASQSGLSIEHACGTGAACVKPSSCATSAFASGAATAVALTAFNAPVVIVDFSVDVAPNARR